MTLIKDEYSALHTRADFFKGLSLSCVAMVCTSTLKVYEAAPFSPEYFKFCVVGMIFTVLGLYFASPVWRNIKRKQDAEPEAIKAEQIRELRIKFLTRTLYKISEALARIARTMEASNALDSARERATAAKPKRRVQKQPNRRSRKAQRRNRKMCRRSIK